jgi:hypothetical protein
MNFDRRLISCAVIVAAIVVGVPVRAQDTTNSALIQGLVSRATNGEPVEGVTVTAVSDSGSTYSIKTDSAGTFNLKGLPAGHYSLSASRSDFLPYDKTTHSTGVSVSPGQQLKDLRIRLTPGGSIAGRVLDSNRQPVANAVVMAIRPTFVNGRQVLIPDLAHTANLLPIGARMIPTWEYPKTVTDDRGQYRIIGLAPGSYYVSVWSAGAETLDEVTFGGGSNRGLTANQPPIYYPGVVDPGDSVPVRVDGTERLGIDLELRSAALHQIRFQVVPSSAPSEPCRGISGAEEAIVLIRRTPKLDVIQYSSRFGNTVFKKGDDNQWTSPPLPAGSYDVFFNPCMFNNLAMVGALTTHIVDRDVDAGKLVMPLNAKLSGHVQKEDAPSVALEKVQVRLRPLDLRSASVSMSPRLFGAPRREAPIPGAPLDLVIRGATLVTRDGTLSNTGTFASASPGLYQIDIAGLPEEVYVASVKLGGREVRDSGFRVDTDLPGPIEISLSQQGGVVQGVVKDRLGKPVVDSVVALMPSNRELIYSNLFREVRTGQDGTFTIRGIPPGDYAIVAVEDLEIGESRSAEFRDEYQTRILKVVIKQGSLETLSLTVASR